MRQFSSLMKQSYPLLVSVKRTYSTILRRKDMIVQMIQDDTLLTFKEAMGYLRVSRSTLYRLMWSGQLIGHKVGSTWRFYRDDLRACVQTTSYAQEQDRSEDG